MILNGCSSQSKWKLYALCLRDRIRSVIRGSLLTFNTQLDINNIVFKPTPTNKHKIHTLTLFLMREKRTIGIRSFRMCVVRLSVWLSLFVFFLVISLSDLIIKYMVGCWIKCDLYVLHIWFLVHTLICCDIHLYTHAHADTLLKSIVSRSFLFISPVVLLAKSYWIYDA